MRKLILASTVSFLMSPLSTWALGLGDIKVDSVLNEPLSAEIELYSATKNDLDSLTVQLASKHAFARADIERSNFLNKLKFTLLKRKDGTPYIKVTTRRTFREPFVSFLIEAHWQSGRLLREYTLLVDPPELVRTRARPALSTVSTRKSSQVHRTTPKQMLTPNAPRTQVAKPAYASSGGSELTYGPTRRNDTLYTIAKQMAPDGVSVDQMMMALLRDNPEAFDDNNINNLKSGYVLRIKDRESLSQLDKATAASQAREQYSAWKQTRRQVTSNANIVDRTNRVDEVTTHDGKLTLITEGSAEDASAVGEEGVADAEKLKQKLVLANEEIESRLIENQELQARIKELEDLLRNKASLIALKDEGLATLQQHKQLQQQQQIEQARADEVMVEDTAISSVGSSLYEHIDASVELAKLDSPEAVEKVIDASVERANDSKSSSATETSEPAETQASARKQDTQITGEQPVTPAVESIAVTETVKSSVDKIVPESQTSPEKPAIRATSDIETDIGAVSIMKAIIRPENLPYTGGIAAILALLAGFGIARSRRKETRNFEESILESDTADLADNKFDADNPQIPDTVAETDRSDQETSFLSDFSADDMETLQPDDDEADPVSEADVFIVYGRYQQAEELLKGVIEKEPARLDYQMKLLEVYHGENKKDEFIEQATVVKGLLQEISEDYEKTPEWIKVTSWAEKLAIVLPVATAINRADSPDVADMDDMEAIEHDLSLDGQEEADIKVDDFTLDNIDFDHDATEKEGDQSVSDDEIEFSLDEDFTLDDKFASAENIETPEELLTAEGSEEDSFDFGESSAGFGSFEEPADSDDNLNLSQEDSLELEDSLEFENSQELDKTSLELVEDDSDSQTDNPLETDDDGFEPVGIIDENVSDDTLGLDDVELTAEDDTEFDISNLDQEFPELDAIGTKLDLARAYIDMSDMESATSILNEVMKEGNDEQKTQAEVLQEQARLAG